MLKTTIDTAKAFMTMVSLVRVSVRAGPSAVSMSTVYMVAPEALGTVTVVGLLYL